MDVIQTSDDREIAEEADIFAVGPCLHSYNTRSTLSIVLDVTDKAGTNRDFYTPCFAPYFVDLVYRIGWEKSGSVDRVLEAEIFSGIVLFTRCLVPFPILVLFGKR